MKLRKYLKDNGLTVRQFAERADVSKDTVSRVARGKPPRLESAAKIEKATNGQVTMKEMRS